VEVLAQQMFLIKERLEAIPYYQLLLLLEEAEEAVVAHLLAQ
jgi:hypothetical protein